MISVTHQLKAASKKVERFLLRQEYAQSVKGRYATVELYPKEYLVLHQESSEATTEKIKAQAAERSQRRNEKRARLARNQRTTECGIRARKDNVLRDCAFRVQENELSDVRPQPETQAHKDAATT